MGPDSVCFSTEKGGGRNESERMAGEDNCGYLDSNISAGISGGYDYSLSPIEEPPAPQENTNNTGSTRKEDE